MALLNSEAGCGHLILNSLSQSTKKLSDISALPDLFALDHSLAIVLGHITAVLLVLGVANLILVVDAFLAILIVVIGFTLLALLGAVAGGSVVIVTTIAGGRVVLIGTVMRGRVVLIGAHIGAHVEMLCLPEKLLGFSILRFKALFAKWLFSTHLLFSSSLFSLTLVLVTIMPRILIGVVGLGSVFIATCVRGLGIMPT